jgi:hypothetical protein
MALIAWSVSAAAQRWMLPQGREAEQAGEADGARGQHRGGAGERGPQVGGGVGVGLDLGLEGVGVLDVLEDAIGPAQHQQAGGEAQQAAGDRVGLYGEEGQRAEPEAADGEGQKLHRLSGVAHQRELHEDAEDGRCGQGQQGAPQASLGGAHGALSRGFALAAWSGLTWAPNAVAKASALA